MNPVEHGGRLTGGAVPGTGRRRVGPWVLLLACVLLSAPASPGGAGTPSGVIQVAAMTPAPIGLTVQVTLALSGLHPAVTQGGLDCGAIAQSPAWVEARRGTLVDYDSVNQFVLRPAHYLGQESLVSFPVAGRRYSGSTTIRLMLAPQELSDPATHRPWTPARAILVACWLLLNGRPATWDRGPTARAVTASNFAGVSPNPIVVTVADATGAGPWAATGRLSVQGQYFVPAPVSIAAIVQLDGAAAAPVAGVRSTAAAVNTALAPIAPPVSGSLTARGSTRVPAPLNLSGTLMAARSARRPLSIALTGALSAASGTRPGPLNLSAVLSVAGGARLPTSIALSATLAAQGGTHVPASITLSAALTAGGALRATLLPRTQPTPPK